MRKINYVKDSKAFWETRKKSRDAVDKALASRSFTEKLVIADKMHAHHAAMRNAKKIAYKSSPKPAET